MSANIWWVIVACRDEKGVWRLWVPPGGADGAVPGIEVRREAGRPMQRSLEAQLQESGVASGQLPSELIQQINPLHAFIDRDDHERAEVYLAQLDLELSECATLDDWCHVPLLLRQAGPGKARVILNKALQVLAGSLQQSLQAVELDERLRQRILDAQKDDSSAED